VASKIVDSFICVIILLVDAISEDLDVNGNWFSKDDVKVWKSCSMPTGSSVTDLGASYSGNKRPLTSQRISYLRQDVEYPSHHPHHPEPLTKPL